jgi:ATP-dependent Clp protease protease subunit
MTEMYTPTDYMNEFRNYAIKHMGISGLDFYNWENSQNELYSNVMVQDSLTPYILEEREMRVTQMDIFSRLMRDRIIWLAGPVNDRMSTVAQAQLLFLDDLDSESDIVLNIDSPGGSVKSGFSIIDTMEYIRPDIKTINTGMAASMGSVLLGAGTKGKRSMLKRSVVMLHQVSSGYSGNIQDIDISHRRTIKTNKILFELLGEYCDKDPKQVMEDAKRDLWLDVDEAIAYGIVDEMVTQKRE